jgi:hypothetical protein
MRTAIEDADYEFAEAARMRGATYNRTTTIC